MVATRIGTQDLQTTKNKCLWPLKPPSNELSDSLSKSSYIKFITLIRVSSIHTRAYPSSHYSVRVSSEYTCGLHCFPPTCALCYLLTCAMPPATPTVKDISPRCLSRTCRYGYFYRCHPAISCHSDYLVLILSFTLLFRLSWYYCVVSLAF